YLPFAVYQYFNNGGGAAYVLRIGDGANGSAAPRHSVAELMSGTKAGLGTYRIQALEPGANGDQISVEVNEVPAGTDGEGGDPTVTLVVKQGGRVVETH